MNRACVLGLVLFALPACRLPEEQRLPPPPLPADGQPLPYADLLSRARQQASVANEAFYVNRWAELEEVAKGLEQTAKFFPKATDVPAKHKEALTKDAEELGKDAAGLREAAKANDVKKTNEVLQRINLRIRELRLER